MIITVRVTPRAKRESLKKIADNDYRISLKEPAEDHKANIRLTNLLARYFNVPAKHIKIKNPVSRTKSIEILSE